MQVAAVGQGPSQREVADRDCRWARERINDKWRGAIAGGWERSHLLAKPRGRRLSRVLRDSDTRLGDSLELRLQCLWVLKSARALPVPRPGAGAGESPDGQPEPDPPLVSLATVAGPGTFP